jgi:hypothetical protein
MPSTEWVQGSPMHSNRTGGVTVTLQFDIYSDGHGYLICTDKPDLTQPVNGEAELESALRRLWERGMREALHRTHFKS